MNSFCCCHQWHMSPRGNMRPLRSSAPFGLLLSPHRFHLSVTLGCGRSARTTAQTTRGSRGSNNNRGEERPKEYSATAFIFSFGLHAASHASSFNSPVIDGEFSATSRCQRSGSCTAGGRAEILDYFWDIVESTKCSDQPRFDVELMTEGDFFVICVTNCGCSDGHFEDILLSFFNELSPRIEIHSYFETITVIVKGTNGEEWAYDLRYGENRACQICMRRLDAKETRRFAHMKKYQCFKLKSILPSKDVGIFTESLTENMKALEGLHQSYPNAKCTLRSGKKMIYDNRVEPDKTVVNCELMSSAIMKIIVQSSNDEFRTRCLSLLDVSDSLETGEALMSKLTSLVPAPSRQVTKENKLSTASRNNQVRKTVIVKVNQENNRGNDRSSATNSDQGRTNGKENNRADTVDTPIFVSSRGRRVKRTKFYDELYNS